MSIIDTLIYDRTAADVGRWESLNAKDFADMSADERAEWLAGMKGAYKPGVDMNRVGVAVSYIASVLRGYGYAIKVNPKTDWLESDIPTPEQLQVYLANVSAIRNTLAVLPSTPAVPDDMDDLTVEEANAIEKILANVETVIKSMEQIFLHSGQVLVYSGFGLYFLSKAPSALYVSGETLNMDDGASVSGEVLNLSIGAVSNETLTL